jgi:putative (di)nucleoside polyphosphate hydrolase
LRFTCAESEIDPLTPRNGQPAEFDAWRWERLDRVADLVVPFAVRCIARWRRSLRNFPGMPALPSGADIAEPVR